MRICIRLILSAVVAAFTAFEGAQATTAPIGYYPGDSSPADISPNHHDGTVPAYNEQNYGISHYATGKVNSAFHFDGTINYLDLGTWFTSQSFTVGMWIRDNSTAQNPSANGTPLAAQFSAMDPIWQITFNATSGNYEYLSGDGAAAIPFALTKGTWQYLLIVRDGATHITKIYVDGQLAGSATGNSDIEYNFTQGMRFGADFNLTKYFVGDMDEIRFYDRAISADEIAQLSSTSSVNFSVPGSTNPYLAGMPAGTTTGGDEAGDPTSTDSSVRKQSPVLVTGLKITDGASLTFSAAGSVSFVGGSPTDATDGGGFFSRGAENGIAGSNAPLDTLVGVFLDDSQPDGTTAPDSLDFSDSGNVTDGTSYATLSPALKQVFFIGDGLTSSGGVQQIIVPTGAKRLYLATTDGTGWYNNSGSFSVHIVSSAGLDVVTLSATTLKVNDSDSPSTIDPGASLHFAATQSSNANGLKVRVQYSSTPDDEPSWTDLPDGNGGTMALASAGNYVLDSASYPAGDAIYFRAITSATNLTDSISNVVGPFALQQAVLTVSAQVSAKTVHAGDTLTYFITTINSGAVTAKNVKVAMFIPTYRKASDSNNYPHQFSGTEISAISFAGSVVNVSTLAAAGDTTWKLPGGDAAEFLNAQSQPNKAILWTVGDIAPGDQHTDSFSVLISNDALVPSTIVSNNIYEAFNSIVAADRNTPEVAPTIPGIDVRGAVRLTAALDSNVTSVAPGGLFNYTFTLANLGTVEAKNSAIALDVPQFTRFVSADFVDAKGKVMKKPKGATAPALVRHSDGTQEVILLAGKLAGGASQKVRVTFQAQWVSPTEVPKLSTVDYAGALLGANDTPTQQQFITPDASLHYVAFLSTASNSQAFTKDDSGDVKITLAGSLDAQPLLGLLKTIGDDNSFSLDDVTTEDEGDGELLNTVQPGHDITLMLCAINNGSSAAEDVYVQDRLPEGTVLVTPSNKPKVLSSGSSAAQLHGAVTVATFTKSGKKSAATYYVTLDSDERTLRVNGLHLEPQDAIVMTYSVQVPTDGDDAPAAGDILHAGASTIGSSSTPHTPEGFPGDTPIKVVSKPSFALNVLSPEPHPGTTSDINSTANALNAVYKTKPNAIPNLAGDKHYYVDYANTGAAAKNVTLNIPLPPHSVFYRALYRKGNKLVNPPNGVSISTPTFLTNGTVTVSMNKLAAGASGEVMVECLVLDDALDQEHGSFAELDGVEIHDQTFVPGPTLMARGITRTEGSAETGKTTAATQTTPVSNSQLGIMRNVPSVVVAGSTYYEFISIFNYGDTAVENPFVFWTMPSNATVVTFDQGQGQRQNPSPDNPIKTYSFKMASNNGPVESTWELAPHTGATIKITLTASGAAGSTIAEGDFDPFTTHVSADYIGQVKAQACATKIVAANALLSGSTSMITTVTGANFTNLSNGSVLVGLGNGNVLVAGGSNIVAQGGGNIVAQGGGNIVAQGGGNLITLKSVTGLSGIPTASSVMQNLPSIVAQGGGNIWNCGGSNLISNDGASLISNDGGSVLASIALIVAQGAGNIVAQGAGNIVAQGAGNIVAQGAGNIVAQGAGNLITYGGGIVAQGGGNLGISLQASSAIVAQGAGNIVAQGAGNIVAQGAGNIVAGSGGNILPRTGAN